MAPFLLSLVLVLQVLPGHFQLAFMTQCGVVLIVAWSAVERWGAPRAGRRFRRRPAAFDFSMRGAARRRAGRGRGFPPGGGPALADGAAGGAGRRPARFRVPIRLCLDAVPPGQFRRARAVPSFAAVAALVWDPFHTSPEEQLAYIGLVPLFLAGMAMLREWRRDRRGAAAGDPFHRDACLESGPVCAGVPALDQAAWLLFLPSSVALDPGHVPRAGLAGGKGFDGWAEWPRPGRSLRRFSLAALFWVVAMVGLIELALSEYREPGLAGAGAGLSARF